MTENVNSNSVHVLIDSATISFLTPPSSVNPSSTFYLSFVISDAIPNMSYIVSTNSPFSVSGSDNTVQTDDDGNCTDSILVTVLTSAPGRKTLSMSIHAVGAAIISNASTPITINQPIITLSSIPANVNPGSIFPVDFTVSHAPANVEIPITADTPFAGSTLITSNNDGEANGTLLVTAPISPGLKPQLKAIGTVVGKTYNSTSTGLPINQATISIMPPLSVNPGSDYYGLK